MGNGAQSLTTSTGMCTTPSTRWVTLPPRDTLKLFATAVRALEESGFPLLDAVDYLPLDDPTDHIGLTKHKLSALPPGLTHFLMHPAVDTPELRAMAPDWPSRVANYEAFISRDIRDFLRTSGIHVIGYRPLRDLMKF